MTSQLLLGDRPKSKSSLSGDDGMFSVKQSPPTT
jgi:hypothetical protein